MCSLGRCPGVRELLRSWKCPGGFKSVNDTWVLSTQAPEASAGANSEVLICSSVFWVIITKGSNLVLYMFFRE